jgi:hypothetical protein
VRDAGRVADGATDGVGHPVAFEVMDQLPQAGDAERRADGDFARPLRPAVDWARAAAYLPRERMAEPALERFRGC